MNDDLTYWGTIAAFVALSAFPLTILLWAFGSWFYNRRDRRRLALKRSVAIDLIPIQEAIALVKKSKESPPKQS